MSVVWLCAQGEGKGQEVLMTPHKPRTMRAVRNVTAPDGAGNGAGTRSEIRSSKPFGRHHC